MGAVGITYQRSGVDSNGERIVEATVAFSNSYSAGGDTVDMKALGLGQVNGVRVPSRLLDGQAVPNAHAQVGVSVQPAIAADGSLKLKLYPTANTEAAAASNNSSVVLTLQFLGR